MVDFNHGSNLYNGKTIEEIEELPFTGWHEHDKQIYINNCREAIHYQMGGINAGIVECIKRSNFMIAKNYVEQ